MTNEVKPLDVSADSEPEALERTAKGHRVRLRYGKGLRGRFLIRLLDPVAAERRAVRLRALAELLSSAGHSAEAPIILRKAAAVQSEKDFAEAARVAEELCRESPTALKKVRASAVTFEMLGRDWTSGRLHQKWPDHVKLKSSADKDAGRLAFLYDTIGKVRLEAFTLEDAERAMGKIDVGRSSATRRHYAQLISKVLRLAVYPCRIIEHSPLPVGFLPRVKTTKATAYLYPSEEAKLLAHKPIPLERRAFYGLLAREGMRRGEALALTWADVDLERGAVRLDTNKTDDPRAWALSPGVAATLAQLKPEKVAPTALVFSGLGELHHIAATFRADLGAAGVKRAELTERSAVRRPIRLHDLRATFVTLSLAAGRSEAWVSDRTGHKSSIMINKYRRAARSAGELGLGDLRPLDVALPELAALRESAEGGPEGGPATRPALQHLAAGSAKTQTVSSSSPYRTRTGTTLRSEDFKSPAYAIPPRGLGGVGIALAGGARPPKLTLLDA